MARKRINPTAKKDSTNFPGYPLYPPSEDIYNRAKEEQDINPEDITKNKAPNEKPGTRNEKDFKDDRVGDDLDIPGSELDDEQEKVGSEDEENNYYSLRSQITISMVPLLTQLPSRLVPLKIK